MKLLFIALSSLFLLSGSTIEIDEYTGIAVNVANEEKTTLETIKCSYAVSSGLKSSVTLKLKGIESTVKLNQGSEYEFYIRYTKNERGGISLVKFEEKKGNRVAEYISALKADECKNITFIPIASEKHDGRQFIYKIKLISPLEPGSYGIINATPSENSIPVGNFHSGKCFAFDVK